MQLRFYGRDGEASGEQVVKRCASATSSSEGPPGSPIPSHVIESFMSITTAQFTAALDALREVLAFRHPADAVLSHFFRNHRSSVSSIAPSSPNRCSRVAAQAPARSHGRRRAAAGDVLLWLARFSDAAPGS